MQTLKTGQTVLTSPHSPYPLMLGKVLGSSGTTVYCNLQNKYTMERALELASVIPKDVPIDRVPLPASDILPCVASTDILASRDAALDIWNHCCLGLSGNPTGKPETPAFKEVFLAMAKTLEWEIRETIPVLLEFGKEKALWLIQVPETIKRNKEEQVVDAVADMCMAIDLSKAFPHAERKLAALASGIQWMFPIQHIDLQDMEHRIVL